MPETWFFRGGPSCSTARRVHRRARRRARRRTGPRPERPVQHRRGAVLAGHRAARAPGSARRVPDRGSRSLRSPASPAPRPGGSRSFAFRESGPDVRTTHFRPDRRSLGTPPRDPRERSVPAPATSPIPTSSPASRPFDLILCRNLFIYLTADAPPPGAGEPRPAARAGRLAVPESRPRPTGCRPTGSSPTGPSAFGIYRRAGVGGTITPGASAVRPLARQPVARCQPRPRNPQPRTGG